MRDYGTDINAGINYNSYHSKNSDFDVTGQYGKHFGGPGGNGDPQGSILLNARGTF